MKKYLQSLPSRSVSHRKHFAMLAAGGITLFIFTIWALVKFGIEPELADAGAGPVNLAASGVLSPVENIMSGFKEVWYALTHLNGQ